MLYFYAELLAAVFVYAFGMKLREHWVYRLIGGAGILCLFFLGYLGLSGAGAYLTDYSVERTTRDVWQTMGSSVGYGAAYGVGSYYSAVLSLLGCALLAAGVGTFVWLVYAVSYREALYCVICGYLTEHIAFCVRVFINESAGQELVPVMSATYLLIYLLVYLLAWNLFASQMQHDGHYGTVLLEFIWQMLFVLGVVLVLSVVASRQGFSRIHSIYASVFCVYALYSQVQQQTYLATQRKLIFTQNLIEKQKTRYELSKNAVAMINRKCHDLKRELGRVERMAKQGEDAESVAQLLHSVKVYDIGFHTGNEMLDTVLTEKGLLCSERRIRFQCIADSEQLAFLEPMDLYILLSAAIDNAIAGCLGVEEPFIDLSVREQLGLVQLQVANSYAEALELKNGVPVSHKKSADRGYGIHSVQAIAEKYQGNVQFDLSAEHIFILRVTFLQAAPHAS